MVAGLWREGLARRYKVLEEWGGNQGRLPGGVALERVGPL